MIVACGVSVRAQTPAIDLEIAAEARASFDARTKWYESLKGLKLNSLRLRQAKPRETPRIEEGGTERQPTFHVVAVLDTKNQLQLPGKAFAQRDAGRIEAYLQTLREEGADGVTAERGRFGLTERQFKAVREELSEESRVSTKAKRPRELVDALADQLAHRLVIEPELLRQLDEAPPVSAEFEKLSRGTALALLLLGAGGLAFRPQMYEGELRYRVEIASAESANEPPRFGDEDANLEAWPIGWQPEKTPVRLAPELFERIRAEIGGYSLAEAIEAISPRLAIPLFIDRTALARRRIEPEKLQVALPAADYSYFQILKRILYQADLKGTIRVDERGVPFYWIRPLVNGH
jgi:hypothetical protein